MHKFIVQLIWSVFLTRGTQIALFVEVATENAGLLVSHGQCKNS